MRDSNECSNKTFANLRKRIKEEKYLESFKALLLLEEKSMRYPKDAEFKREFMIKNIFEFRNRNYLLRKLENHNRKESVNVEGYTIEHIMPQNIKNSKHWQDELGPDWEEVQGKYLHTIGNLTLTGYNAELSNKSFNEKKKTPGGFADSPIRLNNDLATLECWNETEILKRAERLAEKSDPNMGCSGTV